MCVRLYIYIYIYIHLPSSYRSFPRSILVRQFSFCVDISARLSTSCQQFHNHHGGEISGFRSLSPPSLRAFSFSLLFPFTRYTPLRGGAVRAAARARARARTHAAATRCCCVVVSLCFIFHRQCLSASSSSIDDAPARSLSSFH